MRTSLALASVLLAFVTPALAQDFDTPEALLEAFYEPYLSGEFWDDDSVFRSDALNALYAADAESTPPGEMGALSFDPYIDGQDFDIADLTIGGAEIDGDAAVVEVSFDNFDRPTSITYELVFEDGSWRIDDLVNEDTEYPYRLSEIFEGVESE